MPALSLKIIVSGLCLGALATLTFLLSYAGLLASPFLTVPSILLTGGAFAFCLLSFLRIAPGSDRISKLLFYTTVLLVSINIVLCIIPPIAKDALNHHLAFVKLYLEAGRMVEMDNAVYSYYPALLQMLFIPWVWLGFDYGAKLVHFTFALMTGLLIYDYVNARWDKKFALLSLLIFLSIPIIQKLSHSAYVDLGLIFYSTASLLTLLYYSEHSLSARYLFFAAVNCGFTLAAKPNGIICAVLLGAILLFTLCRQAGPDWRQKVSRLLAFILITLLVISPWYARNYILKSNPFYPQFDSVFNPPTEASGAETVTSNVFITRAVLYGESFIEVLLLPLRVFFTGEDSNPAKFDGRLSPLLIIFLLWAFRSKIPFNRSYLAFYCLGYFLTAFTMSAARARYLSPSIPGLVILAVAGIAHLWDQRKHKLILALVVSGLIGWNIFYTVGNIRKMNLLGYLESGLSRESYLSSQLPGYSALDFVNKNLPADAKIYLIFTGKQTYYLNRDFLFDNNEFPDLLMEFVNQSETAEAALEKFRSRDIRYMIVRKRLFNRYTEQNLKPEKLAMLKELFAKYVQVPFEKGDYAVLKFEWQANDERRG